MKKTDITNLLRSTGTITLEDAKTTIRPGRFVLTPQGAFTVATRLLELATEHSLTMIGSHADGGIPIVSQAVLLSFATKGSHPRLRGFFHRTQIKTHGAQTLTEGRVPTAEDRVALVTDLTTTGNALLDAAATTANCGAHIAFAFTILEHTTQARDSLATKGIPLISLHRL